MSASSLMDAVPGLTSVTPSPLTSSAAGFGAIGRRPPQSQQQHRDSKFLSKVKGLSEPERCAETPLLQLKQIQRSRQPASLFCGEARGQQADALLVCVRCAGLPGAAYAFVVLTFDHVFLISSTQEQEESVIEHRKKLLAKQQASSAVKHKYMTQAVSRSTASE